MIRLHQFPPVFGRNVSPFTLKLETWLRLARLPYEVVPPATRAAARRASCRSSRMTMARCWATAA